MNKEIILILGASSDIGCEIIRQIADDTNIIIAHYNNSEEKIKQLQSELKVKIVPIKADLSKYDEIMRFITFIKENNLIPYKIIHLPAPKFSFIRFKDVTWEDFQNNIDIQLKSIVLILKEFLPLMAKEKKGKIIFILSSCTINIPPKFLSHYVTIKYALLGLMKSLASDYADKAVCINAISPSMVETRFLQDIPEKIIEMTAEGHPLKRNAIPKDIVPLIKCLLSSDSDYISGVNIPVCGGIIF